MNSHGVKSEEMTDVERHPLAPFLPTGARLLMLGSFPPARRRWAMDFFYPNFTNDMWRIFGLCFYGDKLRLVDEPNKTYRQADIEQLLTQHGIALYDTATAVRRTTGTASDKDLEVVEPTDLDALLARLPDLRAVVTTGEKATALFCQHYAVSPPRVGTWVAFSYAGHTLRLYRMPSSSRAYPLAVEKKAAFYQQMFNDIIF